MGQTNLLQKMMSFILDRQVTKQKVRVPKHIAIIMDGNGRWAKSRNLPRFSGHLEGGKRVEEIVTAASKLGVKAMTFYTFSTENWNRPQNEVEMIMKTVSTILEKRVKKLVELNIRLNFVGSREKLPQEVLASIDSAIQITKNNTGLILNMAFNYGSRAEILHAVKEISAGVKNGKFTLDDINEEFFGKFLYTKGIPDPDFLIRTSGEQRISNFLLWQLSYTELYFTDKFWPDFNEVEFEKAIAEFQRRERRFGKVLDNNQN